MLYLYKAHIEQIIDGDTVRLCIDLGRGRQASDEREETAHRLWGIDAPEMRGKSATRGKEARAYLVRLLEEKVSTKSPIYVRTVKRSANDPRAKKDLYGRYLAILYDEPGDVAEDIESLIHAKSLDRRSINWQIVEAGHATERYWQ